MKILFLPNWHINYLLEDSSEIQSPDKYVEGKPYWFFKYFPEDTTVDIIDFQKKKFLHKLEKKIKFYLTQGYEAFKIRKQYDIIISHGAQSGLFYSLLCYLSPSKKENPRHFLIDVGGFNGSRINWYETPFVKFALRSRPYIIYHSYIQKEIYDTYYKDVIKDSQFIKFGGNIEEFTPSKIKVEDYVLSFGADKRDYDSLISAWKQIKTDMKLLIIGSKKKDIDKNIEFLTKVPVNILKDYISKALFVAIPLPYYKYSYGQMSFIQSMCMGKVVLVTNAPSTDYYLEDGKGAFYVKMKDPEDWRAKIEYLLENKDKLIDLGKQSREFATKNLSEERMGKEIYEFIEKQAQQS